MTITRIIGTLLLGSAGLAAAAGSEPASSNKPFDWSGPYVGIHLGHGWSDSNFVDSNYNGAPPFPTVAWGVDSDRLLAGFNAGYNWRRDDRVWGIEGEIGRLNLSSIVLQPGVDPFGAPYDASGTVDGGWHAGLSARLGYASDRTLLYAKAGVVYSRAKLGILDTCTVAPCGNTTLSASEKVGLGYQLGAGVEHALTDRWTIKAEYTYMDFGNGTISGAGVGGAFNGVPFNIQSDLSVHTVRVGLNYKF